MGQVDVAEETVFGGEGLDAGEEALEAFEAVGAFEGEERLAA